MADGTRAAPASPRSRALWERACASLPGGNSRTTVFRHPHPLYAARGKGCRVWDVDGRERIDAINNFTALIHGHAHPAVVEAACGQVARGSSFGLPTEAEVALAERLCGRVRAVDQVRFTNSGTEAVMMAVKAARAFTGRPGIAKCEGSYHGAYDYAEVSLDPPADRPDGAPPRPVAYARGTPEGVLDDVAVLPFNDLDGSVAALRRAGPRLACLLLDPMPNRAGLVPAEPAYLAGLAEACREVGALLVLDEVITFRLGPGGAQELWGVEPDLTAFGKIIGGGFPVGAVGGRQEVMAVFDPRAGKPALPHGGTFSANPVTMVAGLAAMDLLDDAAFRRLDALGAAARDGIDAAFREAGLPGRTTGAGSLLRIHFTDAPVRDYRSAAPDPAGAARQAAFSEALLEAGVLAAPNGLMALSTPMTEDDVAALLGAVRWALARLAA